VLTLSILYFLFFREEIYTENNINIIINYNTKNLFTIYKKNSNELFTGTLKFTKQIKLTDINKNNEKVTYIFYSNVKVEVKDGKFITKEKILINNWADGIFKAEYYSTIDKDKVIYGYEEIDLED